MLLSSLILEQLCCNYEMRTDQGYSLETLQACAAMLKTQGGICLSSGSPLIVEFKATIELTLWHQLPILEAQPSSLIDMWRPTESSANMSDFAIQMTGYAMVIRLLLFLVGELQGPPHHFFTVYERTAPSLNRHCTESAWPTTHCVTFVEKRKTLHMPYVLVPPTPRRGNTSIAIFAMLVGPSHR